MSDGWRALFFALSLLCFIVDVMRVKGWFFKPSGDHALMSAGLAFYVFPFFYDALKAAL